MPPAKGNKILLCFMAALIAGCHQKEESKEYSARVEKEYLFSNTLDSALTTEKYKNYFKDEYVNRWVRDRLLYNEAVKSGILESSEFKSAMQNIKEETAIALYLKTLNENFDLSYDQEDLKKFYDDNAEEFRCGDDAYVYNEIKFVSYDKAIQFRSTLLESGWDNTFKVFQGDPTIRSSSVKKYAFANQIQPYEIYKIISSMQEKDVSILTESEPGVFTIVQLIKSFLKDAIPDFEYITDNVKERYLMQKRKVLLNEAIGKLYSKYDIEIKKDK